MKSLKRTEPAGDEELPRRSERLTAAMREIETFSLVVAPLDLEWLDMEALAWEAWAAVPRRQAVELRIGKLPTAHANSAMMKLVWVNLLCHAVTCLASTPSPRIDISGGATADVVVFGIRDNGRGFDLDYAGKLFYVFEKIQQQAERPGTGVGLAIVQRIVTRHRGNVWIEARGGEGSFIQFSLPVGETPG